MRSTTIAVIFHFCLVSVGASILKGFTTKEVPSLEEIPNIAEQVRRRAAVSRSIHNGGRLNRKSDQRVLKGESKSKSNSQKDEETTEDDVDKPSDEQQDTGDRQVFPYIPEAPPEFSDAGELSFVIVRACILCV